MSVVRLLNHMLFSFPAKSSSSLTLAVAILFLSPSRLV